MNEIFDAHGGAILAVVGCMCILAVINFMMFTENSSDSVTTLAEYIKIVLSQSFT